MTPHRFALVLLVLAGCAAPSLESPMTSAMRDTRSSMGAAMSAANIYRDAVNEPGRSQADRDRDATRRPAEVLAFFGIEPGMRVLDMYSGGGYYAELLAHVVGPEGHVSAHNNRAYLSFAGDEIEARYANGRLDQVETLMAENNELSLAPASYDAITLVLTYHDFYLADPDNGWPAIDAEALRAELFKGLRPGGVVGIIDHAAPRGAPSSTGGDTHRIDPDIVFREMAASGFILERHSALLNNPADDRLKSAFDPSIRGRTDRFMMRFRKP